MNISATMWPSLLNPQGKRFSTTWPKLLDRLAVPRICAEKDGIPGVSLATFNGDRRALANVEQVFAVGIDLDHLTALSVKTKREPGVVYEAKDWTALRQLFASGAAFVHTTWSSTFDLPRLRAFLLLSRPVNASEYRRVYQVVANQLEECGLVVDRQASDPSRLWYLPAVRAEGCSFVFWTCNGPPLDVDGALALCPASVPPPPPTPRPTPTGDASVFDRARKYLAKCDPAIQGSGGRTTTFLTAQRLVRGFALSNADAFDLMSEWNTRCVPPWSERELRAKIEEAATKGRWADGDMLERRR